MSKTLTQLIDEADEPAQVRTLATLAIAALFAAATVNDTGTVSADKNLERAKTFLARAEELL